MKKLLLIMGPFLSFAVSSSCFASYCTDIDLSGSWKNSQFGAIELKLKQKIPFHAVDEDVFTETILFEGTATQNQVKNVKVDITETYTGAESVCMIYVMLSALGESFDSTAYELPTPSQVFSVNFGSFYEPELTQDGILRAKRGTDDSNFEFVTLFARNP